MAIIKLGSTILGIRGSIGGVTYSAGLGGPYARAWGRSSNPRGQLQQRNRAHLGGLGAAWQGLTAGERGDWDTFAATDPEPTFNSLGEPVTLSGWGYFVRCNTRRLRNGQELMPLAPTGAQAVRPASEPTLSFIVEVLGSETFEITWDTTVQLVSSFALAFVSVLPSGSPVYTPSVLKFVASAGASTGILSAFDAFIERFGTVQKTWICSGNFYIQLDSGLRSTPFALLEAIG